MLPQIVAHLETYLGIPKREIIVQDDKLDFNPAVDSETFLYYTGKGQSLVKMKDPFGKEHKCCLLEEGEHFGEISILY